MGVFNQRKGIVTGMALTRAGFEFDSETYHKRSATHRFEYDPASTPAHMAVVSALSAVLGVGPTDMEPLAETVDTDALDALVRDGDPVDSDIQVSWTQAGFSVTVHSYGAVTMSPAGDGRSRPAVER